MSGRPAQKRTFQTWPVTFGAPGAGLTPDAGAMLHADTNTLPSMSAATPPGSGTGIEVRALLCCMTLVTSPGGPPAGFGASSWLTYSSFCEPNATPVIVEKPPRQLRILPLGESFQTLAAPGSKCASSPT